MLYQIIATTKDKNIIHVIYIDNDFSKPVAVVHDHDFRRFIIESIQGDPDLKEMVKNMIERL